MGPTHGEVTITDERPQSSSTPREILSIGHSTLGIDAFLRRLAAHDVSGLADVRRHPASRRHPQFNRDVLADVLRGEGIEYRWFEALGGRRSASPEAASSSNAGLQVAAFRAYADYALTAPFRAALEGFLGWAAARRVAVCCAEALWWRCHRRILADHLVLRGHRVLHVLDEGPAVPHELWDLARPTPQGPVYPPPQASLFAPPG